MLLFERRRTSVDLCRRAGPAKSFWVDTNVLQGTRIHLRDAYGSVAKAIAVAVHALISVVGLSIQKARQQFGWNAVPLGRCLGVVEVAWVYLPHICSPVGRQRLLNSIVRKSWRLERRQTIRNR